MRSRVGARRRIGMMLLELWIPYESSTTVNRNFDDAEESGGRQVRSVEGSDQDISKNASSETVW